MLRKRISGLEDDCEKDKKMIDTLTDALAKARLVRNLEIDFYIYILSLHLKFVLMDSFFFNK